MKKRKDRVTSGEIASFTYQVREAIKFLKKLPRPKSIRMIVDKHQLKDIKKSLNVK